MDKRKRILLVHYSQTGQLSRIARTLAAPLEEDTDLELVELELEPERAFPFPWGVFQFMDAFPECVWRDPPPLREARIEALSQEPFDLVILCYQVWFLSPSLPVTAFVQSSAGRRLLADTPVVTVIGCRNMWTQAHAAMEEMLAEAGARLTDNVVLTDPGGFETFYTTPRWLLTGRQGRAGIPESEIQGSVRFGHALRAALKADRERQGGPLLAGLGAVRVDPALALSEGIGIRSFRLWGRLIRLAGPMGSRRRRPLLALYMVFLVVMILTIVPVVAILKRLARPLLKPRLNRLRARFEAPSGSGQERLAEYGHD